MPIRISTLFLIVIASAVPFMIAIAPKYHLEFAIWLEVVILGGALWLYSIKNCRVGCICAILLVLFGIVCPAVWSTIESVNESRPEMAELKVFNPEPKTLLGFNIYLWITLIWLLSILLIYHRAIECRRRLNQSIKHSQITQTKVDIMS
jgi:hypothetical protein